MIFDRNNPVERFLLVYTGAVFDEPITFTDDGGTPIDMSSTSPLPWGARFDVMTDFGKTPILSFTNTSSSTGSHIALDGTGGYETIIIPTDTTALPSEFLVFSQWLIDNQGTEILVSRGLFYPQGA